jgi:curved DNA-binding protein CbpA
VSQWHPDRLESRTEEVRQFATKKMVAINAAYRLLRSCRLPKSI